MADENEYHIVMITTKGVIHSDSFLSGSITDAVGEVLKGMEKAAVEDENYEMAAKARDAVKRHNKKYKKDGNE